MATSRILHGILLVLLAILLQNNPDLFTRAQRQEGDNVVSRMKRFWRGVTYTGTKWCGPGNDAEDYDELGRLNKTDACCREHDHCDTKIKRFRKRFHYFNWRAFTISLCECDEKFRDCLYVANTTTSDRVGDWFFNRFDIDCFDLSYEQTCVERYWWGGCQRYDMDYVAHPSYVGPYAWWRDVNQLDDY